MDILLQLPSKIQITLYNIPTRPIWMSGDLQLLDVIRR